MPVEALGRYKQPEYTGENRCLPCTVVNTVIAIVLSAGVGGALAVVTAPVAGAVVGLGLFVASMLAIYVRGYLVPGTPELTKQYFPAWLLEVFGKGPESHESVTEIDPETELTRAGALEECEDSEDLCLTDAFQDAWNDEISRVKQGDADRDQLLDLLELDDADVEFREYGTAFVARIGHQQVGKWESQAAFLADLGAARALSESHPEWDRLSVEAKSQLLNGLRLFIDSCPSCGGVPAFGTETVESCCSTHEVAAVTCPDCEVRLFETPVADV